MNTPSIPALILPFLVMGGILVGTVQPSKAGQHLVGGYSEASDIVGVEAERKAIVPPERWPCLEGRRRENAA